jgi:hypothetical protein
MKKMMVSLFVLVAFIGFSGSVHAATVKSATKAAPKYKIVIGKVISIDTVKNTFVDKVTKTQEDKTFSASAVIISKLKVDEDTKLFITPGTDVVVKVKELTKAHVALTVPKK